MRVREKLGGDLAALIAEGPITIVAFGDSLTHGALSGTFNYESVYWNRLRQRMNALCDYVPVNVINAGIGGATAQDSLSRIERQVLSHSPDLVIVCFGLNDINGTLEEYLASLREIFERTLAVCDVVFLTPNMLNTYVAEDTPTKHLAYAKITAEYQNGGRMDAYMAAAIELAESMGVPVCDAYGAWKRLSKTEDTTKLLANRINHPVAEMHALFADLLFDLLFGDMEASDTKESAMYEEKTTDPKDRKDGIYV